jgi:hypothetical protein
VAVVVVGRVDACVTCVEEVGKGRGGVSVERVVKSVHAPCSVFKECGAAPLCHAVSTTLRKRVPRHALSVWDENQWRSVGNKASFLICTQGGVP